MFFSLSSLPFLNDDSFSLLWLSSNMTNQISTTRHTHDIQSVRWAEAGAGDWSGVREKYCWLAGGWKLVLERCKRKTLLGWRLLELPNRVIITSSSKHL